MSFQLADVNKLYEKDPNLKREDVQILKEWMKKQPHLPEIEEIQLIITLHSCYYRIEEAKTTLDTYFTVKTHSPDLFGHLDEETLRRSLSTVFVNILPKRTPEGYSVMLIKLLDAKLNSFNIINIIKTIEMVNMLHLHQDGFDNGAFVVFDMEGYTLAHLTKMNMVAANKAFYFLQEGTPMRLKGLHFINMVPFADKLIAMVKPFLKQELYNMLTFHSNYNDTFYKYVPKECLPKDYGGEAPSINVLNETCIKNIVDNFDFYTWHDSQKVDESKRFGKSKINTMYGVEGTFKKLEID